MAIRLILLVLLASTTYAQVQPYPTSSGCTLANPSASVGLTVVNGVASTCMGSDAAPPLSQGIVPTWTGVHTFSATPVFNAGVSMPNLAASSTATTGTVCWTTGGNLTVDTTLACLASTRKIKQAVEPLDSGLADVMKLTPVSYDLKPKYNPMHLGRQVGLIAEEVQKADPRLVGTDTNGDLLGVRYMQLTAVLVKAIQEQQSEIDQLKRQLKGRTH